MNGTLHAILEFIFGNICDDIVNKITGKKDIQAKLENALSTALNDIAKDNKIWKESQERQINERLEQVVAYLKDPTSAKNLPNDFSENDLIAFKKTLDEDFETRTDIRLKVIESIGKDLLKDIPELKGLINSILSELKKSKGISEATSSFDDLIKVLNDKLRQIRSEHPSFLLMEVDDKLFPNGKPELHILSARDDANQIKTVSEIVKESWERDNKNHLMIEGEGGIGKTVTLLSLPDKFVPHTVPAIYIQLHKLKNVSSTETIEDYIKSEILRSDQALLDQLNLIANEPWKNGPKLLLLLDGFNEIAYGNREAIGNDIARWSDKPGVQVITSSRYDIHTYVALGSGYCKIELQPLSKDTVTQYLDSTLTTKPLNQAVWNLITFPLMLALYVKTEAFIQQKNTEKVQTVESNSAGAIIWNYLQYELWRFRANNQDAMNCVVATEFVAPYIAWRMYENEQFRISAKTFWKLCDEAMDMFRKTERGKLSKHIQMLSRARNVALPTGNDIEDILKNDLRLFTYSDNSFSLMHQQFRDALAAIHLINVSRRSNDTLTEEWIKPIDYYVMNFVSELITKAEALHVWELNRKSAFLKTAMLNQLELQKRLNNYDFSQLNFSGLDLGDISLYPYHVPKKIELKLPTDANLMDGTKLSDRTFEAEGHEGSINAVAVTPDGRRCVSASNDGTLKVWNLVNGECLHTLEGHIRELNAVAVTPDGRQCVSASNDGTLKVWDLVNGVCLHTLEGHNDWINAVAVTPDGRQCVSASDDRTLKVWDLVNGECLHTLEGHNGRINAVAVTPDGRQCVSATGDGTLKVWDLVNGECLHTLEGHESCINAVAVTPDGRQCVSATGDGTLKVWDLVNGVCLHTLEGHNDWINAVAVTPDGRRCVSLTNDGTLKVWDLVNGVCLHTLEGHESCINAVAVIPDGRQCVSASYDGTLRIWDMETRQLINVIKPLSVSINGVNLSKASFSSPELKEQLRQNGAIVESEE